LKVTRILQADVPFALLQICKVTGFLRADIWRRYGALRNVGKSALDIRKEIVAGDFYVTLDVDGTIRNETTKDVVNDLLLYKAAAKGKVRKAIWQRTDNKTERKRLYTLLRSDAWMEDPFLHRQMRKHFKHGVSHTKNQFVVRSDKFKIEHVGGYLTIIIQVARKYGDNIVLTTTSNGTNVDLSGCNLRVIVRGDATEIHYSMDKGSGRPHGNRTLGLDKGYTEAFVDSDGEHHGVQFGAVMTGYSDKVSKTSSARNKLHALEKKHRQSGNSRKADNIRTHNLGRKKIDARKRLAQTRLRGIAFKAAHAIVDKAAVVVSEDLTSPIPKKHPWKRFNRRMSGWAKGALAEALDSVCTQREASYELVNCAYTSQMDSVTGLLQGKRVGDKFYRVNGDVIQADHNAARNVLARLSDKDIGRFTSYREVKRILLARSPAELTVKRHELQPKGYQPCAEKPSRSEMINF